MIHVFKKGTADRTFLLLHGTGGSATQLFDLAHELDPQASRLGIQGDVNENGILRYFKRFSMTEFDDDSIRHETQKLFETLETLKQQYNLKRVLALGFSNGANILQSMMKTKPLDLEAAILLHPSLILKDTAFAPQDYPILATHGYGDPFMQDDDFFALSQQLPMKTFIHNQSHQVTDEEVEAIRHFLSNM